MELNRDLSYLPCPIRKYQLKDVFLSAEVELVEGGVDKLYVANEEVNELHLADLGTH